VAVTSNLGVALAILIAAGCAAPGPDDESGVMAPHGATPACWGRVDAVAYFRVKVGGSWIIYDPQSDPTGPYFKTAYTIAIARRDCGADEECLNMCERAREMLKDRVEPAGSSNRYRAALESAKLYLRTWWDNLRPPGALGDIQICSEIKEVTTIGRGPAGDCGDMTHQWCYSTENLIRRGVFAATPPIPPCDKIAPTTDLTSVCQRYP
jgi:hypothetical protein